jgi:adenylate kinase
VLVAVSGTPGAGKSSACRVLAERGHRVLDLNKEAVARDLVLGRDDAREAVVIDTDGLNEWVRSVQDDLVFLDGHVSHLLDVDVSIVLRCNPNVLGQRLSSLGWNEQKVAENVEAEAIDVILAESLENHPDTFEVDTTEKAPGNVADIIMSIIDGEASELRAGSVDWSEVIMGWY